MKRREFLSSCVTGVTISAASLPLLSTTRANTKEGNRNIDPDKLSQTAYQQFIPGKLTCCESILMAAVRLWKLKVILFPT